METDLLGSYAEPREWLLRYLKTARFTNTQLTLALQSDWTLFSQEKASYLLGAIWGRLRQADTSLETSTEYIELVEAEFDNFESKIEN
jgi:hypothetical protein